MKPAGRLDAVEAEPASAKDGEAGGRDSGGDCRSETHLPSLRPESS